MDETAITDELTAAQAAVLAAPVQRREAVATARAAGWSKYKIAKTLGVSPTTVDSIIATLDRNNAKES